MVAAMLEPMEGVDGGDDFEAGGNGLFQSFLGARLGFAQKMLQFGERLLDGVEVRAVGRQENELATAGFDAFAHRVALVDLAVVQDDRLAGAQVGAKRPFKPTDKRLAVGGPLDGGRSDNPLAPHGGEQGGVTAPVARGARAGAFALARPPVEGMKRPVGPALVHENQVPRL